MNRSEKSKHVRVLLVASYILGVLWALTVMIMIAITLTLGYTIAEHFLRPAIWGLIVSACGGLLGIRYPRVGGAIMLGGCVLMAIEEVRSQIFVPLGIGLLFLYCGWKPVPK